MSTNLLWSTFTSADCDSFNIYRAITGIQVGFPNSLVIGDVLAFEATTRTQQMVTLTGTDIDTVISNINSGAKGIKATKSNDGNSVFIRCTATQNPRLKLLPCGFLTHIGQDPRIVVPRSEYELLRNQVRTAEVYDYQYADVDGDPTDWYRLTSVKAGVESIPTLDMQALPTPEAFCVVEGRVIDLQNRPVVAAEVRVAVMPPVENSDNNAIMLPDLVVRTDSYGRWSVPLLQGQSVLFRIPIVGYNHVVTIPAQNYVLFQDLVPTNDDFFSAGSGIPVEG